MARKNIGNIFANMTADEQVAYCIESWNDIWTPVNEPVDFNIDLDIREYMDDYYIPALNDELKNNPFEKYTNEIIAEIRPPF